MDYIRKDVLRKPSSLEDVLNLALAREKTSYEFYNSVIKKVRGKILAELLKELRDIEFAHILKIENMLDRFSKVAKKKPIDYIRKDKFTKPYSPADVLNLALAKEKTAYEFYGELVRKVENKELLKLLTGLRDDEGVHVQRIKNMLERAI